jgi:hypothetical protein
MLANVEEMAREGIRTPDLLSRARSSYTDARKEIRHGHEYR